MIKKPRRNLLNSPYSTNYLWIQHQKNLRRNVVDPVFKLKIKKTRQFVDSSVKNKKNRFQLSQTFLNLTRLPHVTRKSTTKLNTLLLLNLLTNLPSDLIYLVNLRSATYVTLSRKIYYVHNLQHSHIQNPLFNNIITKTYKTNYTYNFIQSSKGVSDQGHPITKTNYRDKLSLLKTFNGYVRTNTHIGNQIFYNHSSLLFNYFYKTKFGISVTSLPKLFNKWHESYLLLFNLFFFNIEILAFGSAFFKKEILSINWKTFHQFQFMWRYTKPLLMFSPNRIFNYGDMVFQKIRLLGLNTAYITDVLYHNKTIYYLHRAGFYTIGPVPSNYNINTVNYAIPTADDNLLTQLFFIRFVISVQRLAKSHQFTQNKLSWSKFNKLLL